MEVLSLKALYLYLLLFFIIQRILELILSKRNEAICIKNGGRLVREWYYPWMIFMHVSWFLVCSYLLWKREDFVFSVFSIAMLFLLAFGTILRALSMLTLKERWTVKIYDFKIKGTVSSGIYKVARHPNYFGVVLELFAFPALLGSVPTAVLFSLINILIVSKRARLENSILH